MKKKAILLVVGAVAVVLGIFLSSQNYQLAPVVAPPSPSPRQHVVRPTTIVFPGVNHPGIITSIPLPTAPTTLPVYSYVQKVFSEDDARAVSKELGFSLPPLQKNSKEASFSQWSQDNSSLMLVEQNNSQRWSFSQRGSGVYSSRNISGAQAAQNLFYTVFFAQKNLCSFYLSSTSNGPFDGLVSNENLLAYYFSCLTPNRFPILGSSYDPVVASIIVTDLGEVRSLSLRPIYSPAEKTDLPVLTPNEALLTIQGGGGILVSLTKGSSVVIFDSPPEINSISFDSYTFAYYPNTKSQTLEPYFVFGGTGKSSVGDVVVKYAVPALVSP